MLSRRRQTTVDAEQVLEDNLEIPSRFHPISLRLAACRSRAPARRSRAGRPSLLHRIFGSSTAGPEAGAPRPHPHAVLRKRSPVQLPSRRRQARVTSPGRILGLMAEIPALFDKKSSRKKTRESAERLRRVISRFGRGEIHYQPSRAMDGRPW